MGWVLPFSSKYPGLKTDAKVRMVNTPDEIKAAVVARLLKKTFARPKVIFLNGGTVGGELIFSAALRNALVAEGITVDDLHVSTAEEMKPRLSADSQNLFFIESHDPARAKTLADAIGQLATIAPTAKISALVSSELTTAAFSPPPPSTPPMPLPLPTVSPPAALPPPSSANMLAGSKTPYKT